MLAKPLEISSRLADDPHRCAGYGVSTSVTCNALLDALVAVGFLRQTRTGAYGRAD